MSVLTDPATYGLNSDLANCPRTPAVLGELAAQWQQMTGTLQQVEQETASSQNLAKRCDRKPTGERLYPKGWSGNTPLGGLAREVAAWLGVCRSDARGWEIDSADHEGDAQGDRCVD